MRLRPNPDQVMDPFGRFRITIRAQGVELRGYIDGWDAVRSLAEGLRDLGYMVVASPAAKDYDPFAGSAEEPSPGPG